VREENMSYRHIKLRRIAIEQLEIIRYEIESPDFNDEGKSESLGLIEIDIKKNEFVHHASEVWKTNKIYPLKLFMMPLELETKAKEKYQDCTSAAWSMAIVDFIKKGFATGEWEGEINLIG
jgi:hypothetical protein